MDEFTLQITLGNDAMQDLSDIADALRRVAGALEDGRSAGPIRDINGNTVGEWATT